MLNISKTQSKNECYISGILNELEIFEGKTNDGREYIRGTAKIRVDQEIDGKLQENIITNRMFSMRKKSDGVTDNKIYDRILDYREKFISLAAAEDVSQASKVTLSGSTCNIEENMWYDKKTSQVRSDFQISCNFMNVKRDTDEDKATFELSGVILKTRPELNKDGDETGRLIVSFGVIGYNGRIDVIELIAKDGAKAHIEDNWQDGDTVNITGIINVCQKTVTWEEPQGFGEPIKRTRTESRRELIITGGSAEGLEESLSYDNDDVKAALAERKKRMEEVKSRSANTAKSSNTTSASNNNFGF